MNESFLPATANELVFWEVCEKWADQLGTTELLLKSQAWAGFDKAWRSWSVAMAGWVASKAPPLREFSELYRDAVTNKSDLGIEKVRLRQWIFLSGLQHGKGSSPEWFQSFADEIGTAARTGDLAFFKTMSKHVRREGDTRDFGFQALAFWIPAALWTCKWDAAANFIQHHKPRDNPPSDPGENLRGTCKKLKLWHDPKPRIDHWDRNWAAVLSNPL